MNIAVRLNVQYGVIFLSRIQMTFVDLARCQTVKITAFNMARHNCRGLNQYPRGRSVCERGQRGLAMGCLPLMSKICAAAAGCGVAQSIRRRQLWMLVRPGRPHRARNGRPAPSAAGAPACRLEWCQLQIAAMQMLRLS